MRLGRDGIAGLIGLAVSLALLPQALNLPKLPIVPVGPGFYPTIVLVFLGLTSAVLLAQDVVAQRRRARLALRRCRPGRRAPTAWWPRLSLIVAVYIALLPLVGFRIATALFVAAFQLAARPAAHAAPVGDARRHRGCHLGADLPGVRTYLLVLLPRGAWTGW